MRKTCRAKTATYLPLGKTKRLLGEEYDVDLVRGKVRSSSASGKALSFLWNCFEKIFCDSEIVSDLKMTQLTT